MISALLESARAPRSRKVFSKSLLQTLTFVIIVSVWKYSPSGFGKERSSCFSSSWVFWRLKDLVLNARPNYPPANDLEIRYLGLNLVAFCAVYSVFLKMSSFVKNASSYCWSSLRTSIDSCTLCFDLLSRFTTCFGVVQSSGYYGDILILRSSKVAFGKVN